MPRIDPLIAVCIPTWGKVSMPWATAYKHLGGPLGSNAVELQVIGKPIAEARNELMQGAIDSKADFAFFLGDDVLAPMDAIIRLLQRMWDDPSLHLATGVYWTKTWPTSPYIWRGLQRGPYLDWKHGEFFEVDYAGCDCLLVRLSPEIKSLGPEWFSTTWNWEAPGEPLAILATEDFYFYTKARQQGLKLWCDTQVQCIHEDRSSGMQFALTTDMPQYGASEPDLPEAATDAKPLVKLAELGSGGESPYFGRPDRVKVVRFDKNEKLKPDYRCDLRHIPVPDQSFDVVHARHVLEHFGRDELLKVMKEWLRILRVGGEIRLSVPNLMWAITQIVLMEQGHISPDAYPWWQLYGSQRDELDFHYNGFTVKRMQLLLERLGLENIEVTTADGDDGELNVVAKATKTKHAIPLSLLLEWDEIRAKEATDARSQNGLGVNGLTGVTGAGKGSLGKGSRKRKRAAAPAGAGQKEA